MADKKQQQKMKGNPRSRTGAARVRRIEKKMGGIEKVLFFLLILLFAASFLGLYIGDYMEAAAYFQAGMGMNLVAIAILSLENKEECYLFFEDICTINELLSLSQRFEVARMLREQKTYLEIAEKTGASTATISRVNRSLNYGNDGYDMVFERLNHTEDSED